MYVNTYFYSAVDTLQAYCVFFFMTGFMAISLILESIANIFFFAFVPARTLN